MTLARPSRRLSPPRTSLSLCRDLQGLRPLVIATNCSLVRLKRGMLGFRPLYQVEQGLRVFVASSTSLNTRPTLLARRCRDLVEPSRLRPKQRCPPSLQLPRRHNILLMSRLLWLPSPGLLTHHLLSSHLLSRCTPKLVSAVVYIIRYQANKRLLVTVESQVPKATVYDMCEEDNILSTANNGGYLVGHLGFSGLANNQARVVNSARSPKDCCQACAANPSCMTSWFFGNDLICNLFMAQDPKTCANNAQPLVARYLTDTQNIHWIFSNGPCGHWENAGSTN